MSGSLTTLNAAKIQLSAGIIAIPARINAICNFLANPFTNKSADLYNLAVAAVKSYFNDVATTNPVPLRIVCTTSDGTCWFDSNSSTPLTYANFIAKTINDNQNTRSSFMQAMQSHEGWGFEQKHSTTFGKDFAPNTNYQGYYSTMRLGPSPDNVVGCISQSVFNTLIL